MAKVYDGEADHQEGNLHRDDMDSEIAIVDPESQLQMEGSDTLHSNPLSPPGKNSSDLLLSTDSIAQAEPGSPDDGIGSTPGSKPASSPSILGEVVWIGICAVLWKMHPMQKFTFTLEMADVISDFLFWWFLDESVGGTRFAVLIFATIGLILQALKIMVLRRSFMEQKDLWDQVQRSIWLGYIILLLEDVPQLVLVMVISADEGYDSLAQLTLTLSFLSILWKVLQQILLKMECIIMDETGRDRGWRTKMRHDMAKQNRVMIVMSPDENASPREVRKGEDVTAMSILKEKFFDLTNVHKQSDAITACILGFAGDVDKPILEEEEREWSLEIEKQRHDKAIKEQFALEDKEADKTGPYQDLFSDVRLLESKDGPVGVSTLNGKFVALYFGGSWCPACIHYYPKLIKAYNEVKALGHDNFEIVYVSGDQDEIAFKNYFAKHPWLALPYAARYVEERLSRKFKVTGIPTVILLDGDAKMYEENGRRKILEPERFPWNQLPPEVQGIIDATGCDRKLAESALMAAYGDANRAFEYVFSALSAQTIPSKAIVEIIEGFYTDYSRNPKPLRQGDRLSVVTVDKEGDLKVMHLEQKWLRPAWIAKWNFSNLRVLTQEELLKEKKDAEKKREEERMAAIGVESPDNPPPPLMKQLSEFANSSSANVLLLEEDPKPMLKKRSTVVGSMNEEDIDVEELVTILIEAMGEDLSREQARKVLNSCDGDIEDALELLCSLHPKGDEESLCANGVCLANSPKLGNAPAINREPEDHQGDPDAIAELE